MISVITLISSRSGLEVLKRNLASLEPDWKLGVDLLCIVNDKTLYLECRDYLLTAVDRGECLVVYDDNGKLKSGLEYIWGNNPYVFLLKEGVILPRGTLKRLYKNYLENPNAGFITGDCGEYPAIWWVKDIYGSPRYVYQNEKPGVQSITEVDVCLDGGLMTKYGLYKDVYCLGELDGYGEYSFGVRLRRQGYQNYINTGVEYKNGGIQDDARVLEKKV